MVPDCWIFQDFLAKLVDNGDSASFNESVETEQFSIGIRGLNVLLPRHIRLILNFLTQSARCPKNAIFPSLGRSLVYES